MLWQSPVYKWLWTTQKLTRIVRWMLMMLIELHLLIWELIIRIVIRLIEHTSHAWFHFSITDRHGADIDIFGEGDWIDFALERCGKLQILKKTNTYDSCLTFLRRVTQPCVVKYLRLLITAQSIYYQRKHFFKIV